MALLLVVKVVRVPEGAVLLHKRIGGLGWGWGWGGSGCGCGGAMAVGGAAQDSKSGGIGLGSLPPGTTYSEHAHAYAARVSVKSLYYSRWVQGHASSTAPYSGMQVTMLSF
jgi:hypothetical protein